MPLILASTSVYRRDLLRRLTTNFQQIKPEVDETALTGELPSALAARLAHAKAQEVAQRFSDAIVIGSDQVAELHGVPLGKPGNMEQARKQLTECSGKTIVFHTALCVVDTRSKPTCVYQANDKTSVTFRPLNAALIEHYLIREQPFDCAGSFKAEGLGITLFERIENEDPTALVGLPLIALCRLLRMAHIELLDLAETL